MSKPKTKPESTEVTEASEGAEAVAGGLFTPYATLAEAYEAASLGYEIVASGKAIERRAEFAKCVHVVSGYALARTLGEPLLACGALEELTPAQIETFVNFSNACRDIEGGSYSSASGVAEETQNASGIFDKINWSKLFELLAPVLIKLLVAEQQPS